MTVENQRLFHSAARRAGDRARMSECAEWPDALKNCLVDLADMVSRADCGEPPLSRSDWCEVVPARGQNVGPGWDQS
jgi:hypothetical protein